MQPMFDTLLRLLGDAGPQSSVSTDDSILLIYPPERELDFREQLLDEFCARAEARGTAVRLLDLSGFGFADLTPDELDSLCEDEFDDFRWAQQSLAQRFEQLLETRLREISTEQPGCAVVALATVALYPLVRFGDVLKGLRDVESRIVLAFPGFERGGRLHFMNQPDGSNYLAVKLFWQ